VIEVISHPKTYFKNLTLQAATEVQASARDEALNYLTELMDTTLKMTGGGDHFGPLATSMASEWIKSIDKSPEEQLQLSKQIGDISLLFTGMFSDSVSRKKFLDLEYYIHMGQVGYQKAHTIVQRRGDSDLFLELSSQFVTYMEILHRVAMRVGLINENNILNIYEKWLQSNSPYLKKLLYSHGIALGHKDKPLSE
jgi:hypothetical protein